MSGVPTDVQRGMTMHTRCTTWRLLAASSLTATVLLLGACRSDGPTAVSAAPARTEISWERCVASGNVPWLAVQDGAGPWRRVTESGGAFAFHLDSARAGVAFVVLTPPSYVEMHLRYYTARELQSARPLCAPVMPAATKRVTGTVAALGPLEYSDIALAESEGYADGFSGTAPFPFTLVNVASGAADLLAVKRSICPSPPSCATATAMIIRRNIDTPDLSVLAPLDFSDTHEAFQFVPKTLTVQGLAGGETLEVDEAFRTRTTPLGLEMSQTKIATTGSTARVPYYGVPDERLVNGDTHELLIFAQSVGSARESIVHVHSVADQSVTLAAALPAVTMTSAHTSAGATIDAAVAASDDFKTWLAEYLQGDVDIVVRVSRGYAGSGTVKPSVPNFTGVVGWLPSWGLRVGVPVNWNLFGVNLDATTIETPASPGVRAFQGASRDGQLTP
jgi:hypothetical protein